MGTEDTKERKPSKHSRTEEPMNSETEAAQGLHRSAPDRVLVLKEVYSCPILNLEAVTNGEPLANEHLVLFKGVSLRKQTSLKGRLHA